MSFYVRKITLSKFPKDRSSYNNNIEEVCADAVSDLRTSSNDLSVWEIPTDTDEDIEDAVLALVTSSKQSSFDRVDFVVFSYEALEEEGLQLSNQVGDTAVNDLKNHHKNITNLTYGSLRSVLELITNKTISGEQIRKTKTEIEEIVKKNLDRIDQNVFSNKKIKDRILDLSK
ncbi:MAG: hypothetical protein KH106_10265 [Lactococcus lactis]|uniref:hypothetical protein n=1 Tax=Lactococcus TaxID=1357 RepID=UPI001D22D8A6|nr:hypothetical protein [Lactococcus lactis]